MSKPWINKLYYGDCLTHMRDMPKNYVDLVYLDPPFNSNRDYSWIYKDETGRPLPEQVEAFNDLWELSEERLRAIRSMPILMRDAGLPDDVAEFWRIWMNALRNSQPRLLAYLSYMTERLLPLRSILKPTGSIYLHCDPTASHYIKAMMDGIFGHQNFRNEIIWKRANAHNDPKGYGRITDTILFYTRGTKYTWNTQHTPYREEYYESHFKKDEHGRWFRTVPLDAPRHGKGSPNLLYDWKGKLPAASRTWSIKREKMEEYEADGRLRYTRTGTPTLVQYADAKKGVPLQNIWSDIPPVNPQARERLGYPTQKPVTLMERIIRASTNEGDLVLDPFCGCASTIEAAHTLNRRWIGIDIAIHAIKRVAKDRLEDRLGLQEGVDYEIFGIPGTLEGAQDVWERDKHQFQKWAIEQVDGFVTSRKTADGGIDGRLYFSLPGEEDLKSMIIEVKGGKNVNVEVIRSLRGALERDDALMAGLIVMNDLGARKTANFRREMGEAGDLNVNGVLYSRMQMLTVSEILEGRRFLTPSVSRGKLVSQPSLPMGR
jgi:DNA modification methylase